MTGVHTKEQFDIRSLSMQLLEVQRSRMFKSGRWRSIVLPILLPILLLLAWQYAVQTAAISRRILPAPLDVGEALVAKMLSGELLRNIAISSWRAAIGMAIGGSLGLVLGALTGLSKTARQLLDSSVQMARNVPHLALIPLVIIWFGIGEEAKIFLIALGVFFPIYLNTYHGIVSIDRGYLEMAKVYGVGRVELLRVVLLPGALPSILVGFRYSLGLMWLTLIVAETIAATSGLGYMAMNAREFMQLDTVVLAILIYAILGKLADGAASAVERRCLRWNPSYAN
jgi:sulfonate transport system permease protein